MTTVNEFLGLKWQEVPEGLRDEFNTIKANFPKSSGGRWIAPQLVEAFERCIASVNWEPPQLIPEEAKMLMQLSVPDEDFHYWMAARQAIKKFLGA